MNGIVILSPDDLPAVIDGIMKIETDSFSVPWVPGDFAVSAGHGVLAVCFSGGDLIGYGCLLTAADEGEITNLAVRPDERRVGFGGMILDRLLAEAQKRGAARCYLEVRESNGAAIALYASRGFSRTGVRRGYYSRPREDAVLMALDISKSI